MDAEFRRVKELFLTALEQDGTAAREAYLGEACDGDVRRQVETLLRTYIDAGDFLESPAVAPAGRPPTIEPMMTRIGPYRLLEQIGEGGMGTVYLAEQTTPVQRQVALKLIRPGMDSDRVLARFEQERQALALMDHPNIARVLDAGTTEQNRPYFVMELVRGEPITGYCDAHRLTPRQRLDLMLAVCQAVQHAHTKGVIHRDLKPSNVLVTEADGRPVVKVIDFGIAKATGQKLTNRTLLTDFGSIIGTLEYMSPEQADPGQVDIDTRSDIYSLGVLLYELLTGTTPFERERLEEAALLEVLRWIREEEPPRPSVRVRTVAGRGRDDSSFILPPASFQELDWIVMKALEKDRRRRYETASGLAADLRRYLDDEPVQACPPSVGYRLRKLLRRHRAAVAMAAALGVGLLLAVGSAGWVMRAHANQRALTEREVTLAIKDVERHHMEGNWPEAQATLKRAEAVVNAGDASDDSRARVERWRVDLGMVVRLEEIRLSQVSGKMMIEPTRPHVEYLQAFQGYGLDVESPRLEQTAERIRRSPIKEQLVAALYDWAWSNQQVMGEEDPERMLAVAQLAAPDEWRDRFLEASKQGDCKTLLAMANDPRATDLPPGTVLLLARALLGLKEPAAALGLCRRVQQRNPGDPWLNVQLAELLGEGRTQGEAIGYWRAFLATRPRSAAAHTLFASGLIRLGWLVDAEAAAREAIRLQAEGSEGHFYLGMIQQSQGKWPEAERSYLDACRVGPVTARCIANYSLGMVQLELGKVEAAERAVREALRIRPKAAGPHFQHGEILAALRRYPDAVEAYRKALALQPDMPLVRCKLGQALQAMGEFAVGLAEVRGGHEQGSAAATWSLPSADWLRTAERLTALAPQLPELLRGEKPPRDDYDRLALADLWLKQQHFATAAKFYAAALAGSPALGEDVRVGHRYNAACAAVLADGDRPRLRREALAWLEAELCGYRKLAGKQAEEVAGTMRHWRRDIDLAGVRGDAVARLPCDERAGWERLWRDVDALHRQAAAKAT